MIALRTQGLDDNPAAASPFVAIPVPIGTRDGDLALVGLAIPGGTTVTPPDDTWELVATTDKAATVYVAVYLHRCLNELDRWVFALSGSVRAVGAAVVYAGVDPWTAVEAFARASSPSGVSHAVAAIATPEDGEELIAFLAADAVGTFTPATGWLSVQAKTQTGITGAAHRRQLTVAGAVAASVATLSLAAAGASIVVALRPGVGTLSLDEVRGRLIAGLPPGADRVYDLEEGGDPYKLFGAIAATAKPYGFDLVDLARREATPERSRYKLPDWERLFGLDTSRIALLGTVPQRQAQVLAAWREAAGASSTLDEVRAIIGVLLGYADPTALVIVEADRSAIRSAHTYAFAAAAIPAGGAYLQTVVVLDSGVVSRAGARLWVNITHPSVEDLKVEIDGPTGTLHTLAAFGALGSGAVVTKQFSFFVPSCAGELVDGTWRLIVSDQGAAGGTVNVGGANRSDIFVEGIGRRTPLSLSEGLGSAVFHWGVVADPGLYGVAAPADFDAARAALQRIKQSHTVAVLIIASPLAPAGCWIPNISLPGAMIPCV